MYIVTEGLVHVYLDNISDVVCKSWRFAFHFGEGFTNWVFALFHLERVFALYFPFFSKKHISPEKVKVLILFVFLLNISIALLAFHAYRIVPLETSKSGFICMGSFEERGSMQIVIALTLMICNFVAPMIIKIILALILLKKLASVITKNELTKHVKHSISTAEEIGAIVIITIAQILLYAPFALSWTLVTSFEFMEPSIRELMILVKRLCLNLSAGVHVWNFFFYLKRIPLFRTEFARIICRTAERTEFAGIFDVSNASNN